MKKIIDEQIQTKLEQELLGALLVLDKKDLFYEIIEKLEPNHFYYDKHKIIYRVIAELIGHHNHVDLTMLATELKKRNMLEKIGGEIYLMELQPVSFADAATRYRVDEILRQAKLRDLMDTCQNTLQRIDKKDYENISELTEPLGNDLYKIEHNKTHHDVDIEKVAIDVIERARALENGGVFGLSWGLTKLDYLTSGIELRKTYVIGGTKKTGKTKFVINTMHALKQQKTKSLFLSLEMDDEGVVRELLSRFARVHNTVLRRKLDNEIESKLLHAADEIADGCIAIDTTPYLSINQIRAKIRRAALKGVKVVFLDYLQRMNFQTKEYKDLNFATMVGHTVSQLADIAKENNVALIFLSQLANRAENKEATISDLKDSGGIAEGVDCILILNNQDRIKQNYEGKQNQVWISVDQRSGASGQIRCMVDLAMATYHEEYEN
jgi:replicative DNA helicase